MKNAIDYLLALLLVVILPIQLIAQANDRRILDISLSAGLMADNLKWSIAGNLNGTNPNIYSELIWKDMLASQVKLDIQYDFWKHFFFLADVSGGFILSGSATDSDYEQDNRTSRTFYAKLNSDRGMSYTIHPLIGYTIVASKNIQFSPAIGYGWNSQRLYLLDNAGLNSTYQTFWNGLITRIGTQVKFNRMVTAFGLDYHQVNYNAKADWNLVESFKHPVSFEHTAKGYGVEVEVRLGYAISESLLIQLQGGAWKWSTGLGIDQLYLNDGTVEKTRLNDVTRNGYVIRAGILYVFRSAQLKNQE